MNIGFALCGSFCTFANVFPILELLTRDYNVIPILSNVSASTNTRFGCAQEHIETITEICGRRPLQSLTDVEPIGPREMLDALIIAPCTGNTLGKLANGIADGPVTMAAKSHLRNGKPLLLAISTNDALSGSAVSIGTLLQRKNVYFVPFCQDDHLLKPYSMISDFTIIPEALTQALHGKQIQPIIK